MCVLYVRTYYIRVIHVIVWNECISVTVCVKAVQKELPQQNYGGLVGRMKDIVSSTVQYGNTLKDSVQKRNILPIRPWRLRGRTNLFASLLQCFFLNVKFVLYYIVSTQ